MGNRRKLQLEIGNYTYLQSKDSVKDTIYCKTCPYHIYSNGNKIIYGIGNFSNGIAFLFDYYDIRKTKELVELLNKIFNCDILDKVYLTRAIKCCHKNQYNLDKDNDCFKSCCGILYNELELFSTIVIFGDEFNLYDTYIENTKIFTTINPIPCITNNDKFNEKYIERIRNDLKDLLL